MLESVWLLAAANCGNSSSDLIWGRTHFLKSISFWLSLLMSCMSLGKHVSHLHAEVDWPSAGCGRHLGHPFKILLTSTSAVEALTTFKESRLDSPALWTYAKYFSHFFYLPWGLSDFTAWKSQRLALHSWMWNAGHAWGQSRQLRDRCFDRCYSLEPLDRVCHIHEELHMVLARSNTNYP